MYTGTLIDDLIAAVERAEEHTQAAAQKNEELEYLLVPALYQVAQHETAMLGAA